MSYSRGSTPGRESYGYEDFSSPTPSPRHYHESRDYAYPANLPPRPATRSHSRHKSTSFAHGMPLPSRAPTSLGHMPSASYANEGVSPRYTSDGIYATADVSETRSSRKYSWSTSRPNHGRRSSQSYYRVSGHYGDSEEDDYIEVNGVYHMLPAQSSSRRRSSRDWAHTRDGHGTDYHYYAQGGSYPIEVNHSSPMTPQQPSRRSSQSRRPSTSIPRAHTARPTSSHFKKPAAAQPEVRPPETRAATLEDARKHKIPEGYSLVQWDPTEAPILLLGSVFDANSLGKWIYDWTVYKHGRGHPISLMAGDLWLLLIQVWGKLKRAEETMPVIRQTDTREMVDDFIESGERLTDKWRTLLKRCEAPMLKANKRKDSRLGSNSGVEFVLTLFGRDRELASLEKFMAQVRLWNLRFDANCEQILLNPSA